MLWLVRTGEITWLICCDILNMMVAGDAALVEQLASTFHVTCSLSVLQQLVGICLERNLPDSPIFNANVHRLV